MARVARVLTVADIARGGLHRLNVHVLPRGIARTGRTVTVLVPGPPRPPVRPASPTYSPPARPSGPFRLCVSCYPRGVAVHVATIALVFF